MTGGTTEFPQIVIGRTRQSPGDSDSRRPPLPLSEDWERARIRSIKQALEPHGLRSVLLAWQASTKIVGSSPFSDRKTRRVTISAKMGTLPAGPVFGFEPDRSGFRVRTTRVFEMKRSWSASITHLRPYVSEPLLAYGGSRSDQLGSSEAGTQLAERFELRRERIGRVRDIDHERGVFLAVLSDSTDGETAEVIGRFPISLLEQADRDRLAIGLGFTLATGRHSLITGDGEILKPSLQTRILLHRPRPMDPAREELARERGRQIRAGL